MEWHAFQRWNMYADEKEMEQTNEKKNENSSTNWIQCGVNGNRFAVHCTALRFISRRDDFKVINFILIFNSTSVHFWLREWESQQMSVYLICQRFSVAKACIAGILCDVCALSTNRTETNKYNSQYSLRLSVSISFDYVYRTKANITTSLSDWIGWYGIAMHCICTALARHGTARYGMACIR